MTALGETYSIVCGTLRSSGTSPVDVASFNGVAYFPNSDLRIGTIAKGVLTLELPKMTDEQLYSGYSGMVFDPASVKFSHLNWLHVRKDGDTEQKYAVDAILSGSNVYPQFICVSGDAHIGGSHTWATGTEVYDMNLKKGWNWVEKTRLAEKSFSFKVGRSATYTWSIAKIK